MSALLQMKREGRLLRLTLNRADKRNALNIELCRALADAFRMAEEDRAVGAVLLDANGPIFCAGMDLKEVVEPGAAEQADIHEDLFTVGSRSSKPIVAAIEGAALAGGMGLVANAHIAIAAEGATFGLTELRIAMWPFVVFRAVSLALGERRAVELSLTARIFGAADALAWGLVHQVVPAADLEARAAGLATQLSEASPEALGCGLDFVRRSRELPWAEGGHLAREMRNHLFRASDFAEGVKAFREKRAPAWPSLHNPAASS